MSGKTGPDRLSHHSSHGCSWPPALADKVFLVLHCNLRIKRRKICKLQWPGSGFTSRRHCRKIRSQAELSAPIRQVTGCWKPDPGVSRSRTAASKSCNNALKRRKSFLVWLDKFRAQVVDNIVFGSNCRSPRPWERGTTGCRTGLSVTDQPGDPGGKWYRICLQAASR